MIPLVPTVGRKQKRAKEKHLTARVGLGLVAVIWSALGVSFPPPFVSFYSSSIQLLLISLMKIRVMCLHT